MTRRLALLVVLAGLASGASAQPGTAPPASAERRVEVTDSVGAALAPADGAALDSLLRAHPDVLARLLDAAEAPRPWWWRWRLPLGLAAHLLVLTGLGVWAYRRLRQHMSVASREGVVATAGAVQAASRTAAQASERVAAASTAFGEDVRTRLGSLERAHEGIEAQLAQTRNLLDRAERLGLFTAVFAHAMDDAPSASPPDDNAPPPASET